MILKRYSDKIALVEDVEGKIKVALALDKIKMVKVFEVNGLSQVTIELGHSLEYVFSVNVAAEDIFRVLLT